MEPPSAANKVASIPDLLENILLHLPLRHLLLAQKVSKSFHLFIHDSIKIKKTLFLTPATNETVACNSPDTTQRRPFNTGDWKTSIKGETVEPLLNPFIINASVPDMDRIRFDLEKSCRIFGRLQARTQLVAIPRRNSLASMQLTHPPVRSMHLCLHAHIRTSQDVREVRNMTGIVYGDLIEMTEQPLVAPQGSVYMRRGKRWLTVPKPVDVLTGWEMVRLLELGHSERQETLMGWLKEVEVMAVSHS
ncbi:hypothetical protein LTR85_006585 [Meristemomyces frigidus]|nr:hypothetical protein LTR85_006585 [Meristemomyces frigidus]